MPLRDQLQSALGSAYVIDRELTGGGMSRVFVATETALGRQVVVKVLHPELAAEVTAERFAREIQLVARLQQANIVPLLTTGHTGEVPFYTMPFVAGQSLRERLTEHGPLPVIEAIGVLRDVARALAYAHAAGVVHRDIKPENVLLSGGAAVVTDFGIAKALSASRTEAGGATITQVGAGIGTPAYMAPEQAAGDPTTDHRADLYAFGCLAYELLTGHPPFRQASVQELMTAHLVRTPVALQQVRADVPESLARLVMRCLEKQPTQRPESARAVLEALDAALRASGAISRPKSSRTPLLAAAAIAVVALIAWAATRDSSPPAAEPAAGPPAVAVIPFANVGGDSAQDYLADGLSDELATAMGKVPGVRLAARSGTYRYRGARDLDVRDVGRALGVAYVVQGTVRKLGTQLRVSAQLTDAASGVELWSDAYDRTTSDIFRTQAEIATAITQRLAAGVADGRGPGTEDAEAYDLYMRAEFELRRRQVEAAAAMFRQAIARDRNFSRAHAGLSQSLALLPYFTPTPQRAVFQRVVDAANTALARDSSLAEAWMSLGLAHMHNLRWDDARRYFERAIAADPADVQSHFQFGRYYLYHGDADAALAEWARAKALDPFSALAAAWTAYVLSLRGRIPEAITEVERALAYDSAVVIRLNALRVYVAAGQVAKARAMADKMPDLAPWNAMRAWVYARTGLPDTARAMLARMETAPADRWFRHSAVAYTALALGDTARALTSLERATDAGEIWPSFHPVNDAFFDSVRASPRWAALMKRVGLDATPGAISR